MEHSIKATETGKIAKVMVRLDDQVNNGATLLVLEKQHGISGASFKKITVTWKEASRGDG